MNTCRSIALLAVCGALMATPARAEQVPAPKPWVNETPRVHLTWNAPWGAPRATKSIVTECGDTTRVDTLFLTFESPKGYIQRLTGISGTLLFEPQLGDTLGAFWFAERGGANGGNVLVDFDLPNSEECQSPWKVFVAGSVGYAHEGGRGRLDLSADIPVAKIQNLFPGLTYYFARVTIHHNHPQFVGCSKPMRITWAGGRFRGTRVAGRAATFAMGPDQSVAWNAPPAGLACRRMGQTIETWVPRFAPPSRAVMAQWAAPTQAQPAIEVEK